MLCILATPELYISCILKRNKPSMLFWNIEDDSPGMNLCHQGARAVAGITNPPPHLLSIHLSSEANGFPGLPGEIACSLQLPGRRFLPASETAVTPTERRSPQQSPLPACWREQKSADGRQPPPRAGPGSLGFGLSATQGRTLSFIKL